MIKVLHFVSTPSIGSGVMNVIMNYYKHLDRSEIQFDFLCFIPSKQSYEDEINELGGQVFFVPKPGSSLLSIKELIAFFEKHQGEYQWLHNHEIYLSAILWPLAKYFGTNGFIIHCHATRYSDRNIACIRNAVLCLPIHFMKCEKLACSNAAGEFLYGKKAIVKGNVKILYNAIDCVKFQFNQEKRTELRNHMGLSESDFILGHVGRFTAQKNHAFLLDIFNEYQKLVPSAKLLCIGDGVDKKKMERKAAFLKLQQKIIFLGQRNDVADLLNVMDVFLLPSLFEGFPVSLVEARCNGLPCFISDTIADEISSDCIIRLSLRCSPYMWAWNIFNVATIERNMLRNYKKYDIHYQTRKLTSIYCGNYEEE